MKYYDEIAKGYDELHKQEQEKKIELIKQHLKPKQNEKLLDVGCGSGLTTRPWKCRRYGIDPSEKLLEIAKAKDKKGIYKKAPAENIPYEDNFFDIVISVTAIQNFNDIKKALNEIKRVGKNRFILSFLKKSEKADKIASLIQQTFNISKIIEEDKDLIFII
jgi:ubiquinone/menaquinone biosynthesis C-methylase UbiE